MEKVPKEIGERYQDHICDECKAKIKDKMSKLKKFDLITGKWKKVFSGVLCKSCHKNVVKEMSKNE